MRIDSKGVLISFHDDPSVTQLVVPATVKKIAPHAFYGAEYLEKVVISEGVAEIGACAFESCRRLRSVIMPESLKKMGKGVFSDCYELVEVKLSAGLKEIPEQTFDNCFSLLSAYIPDGVERICSNAFNSCSCLKTVRLPDSLDLIGESAFMETFSLRSISLPDGLEQIADMTFFRSGLTHISYMGLEICTEQGIDEEFAFGREFSEALREGRFSPEGISSGFREPYIIAFFAKNRSKEAGEYIEKHFPALFKTMIRTGNIKAVSAVIEEGGFLSTRNITRYINFAAEQEQQEIYLMLVRHKEALGGYSGESSRFRL